MDTKDDKLIDLWTKWLEVAGIKTDFSSLKLKNMSAEEIREAASALYLLASLKEKKVFLV